VGRAGPLTIDYFMKIVGMLNIGGFQVLLQ
jgi:hypothetical protein